MALDVLDEVIQDTVVNPFAGRTALLPEVTLSADAVAVAPGWQNMSMVPVFCTRTDCVPAGSVADSPLASIVAMGLMEYPDGLNGST